MKIAKFFSVALISLSLLACGGNENTDEQSSLEQMTFKELSEKITANNDAISSEVDAAKLMPLANNQVLLCETFSTRFPKDENTAEYLYWGAKAARAAQRANKALALYGIIIDKYPTYEKAPEAMFLTGFIYDEDLNDKEKARAAYEKLIAMHPNHNLSKDAAILMEQLYMSDDELIDFLKSKEQENTEVENGKEAS